MIRACQSDHSRAPESLQDGPRCWELGNGTRGERLQRVVERACGKRRSGCRPECRVEIGARNATLVLIPAPCRRRRGVSQGFVSWVWGRVASLEIGNLPRHIPSPRLIRVRRSDSSQGSPGESNVA